MEAALLDLVESLLRYADAGDRIGVLVLAALRQEMPDHGIRIVCAVQKIRC